MDDLVAIRQLYAGAVTTSKINDDTVTVLNNCYETINAAMDRYVENLLINPFGVTMYRNVL